MQIRDKALWGAIVLSVALHVATLFGTPRFDVEWLYREVAPPSPIEARFVVVDSPPKVAPAEPPRQHPKRAVSRSAAPPTPGSVGAPVMSTSLLDAPSPDGESVPTPLAGASEGGGVLPESNAPAVAQPAIEPTEPDVVQYPLKRAKLTFDLYYGRNPTKIGRVTHTWTQDGHRYSAEAVVEAVGFISLFFRGRFVQRSTGQFSKAGLVPEAYSLERGQGAQPEVARFDWEEGKLALSWKTENRLVDLPAGTQDPLSMMHQLYFIKPIPTSAQLEIATGRKLAHYRYTLVGEENLETPLGMLRTVHFRREELDGTLMDAWFDLDRELLPARIYLADRGGAVFDQVIREARTEPVDAAAPTQAANPQSDL